MRRILVLILAGTLAGCSGAGGGPTPAEVLEAFDTVTFDGDTAGQLVEVRDVSCMPLTVVYNHEVPSNVKLVECSFTGFLPNADKGNPAKIKMVQVDGKWGEYQPGMFS